MFAMDPRVVFAESRCDTIFFTKNCTKSVFVCLVLLQIWSYELFLKARHLRDTTNVNNDHLNEFNLVTDALLSTPQTQTFLSKTSLRVGNSDAVFLCYGVKNGVHWA